ncbi:MAG: phage tail protein [Peptococcaceae bacterium]|nr:phage tail protein [Peptococcaceae bacterium]
MYTIFADGNVIFDPRLDESQIISATLTKEDNYADNFTFTPSRDNEAGNSLEKLIDVIEVYDDGALIFRGEVKDKDTDFSNMSTFVCAGELSFLNDVKVRPYTWQNGGIKAYLQFLIDEYNMMAPMDRRFALRDVTVIDPNDYIYRASAQYPGTLDEIRAKLLDNVGGHLHIERINGVTYLDYLEDSPFLSNQGVTLGENILNLKYIEKGADIRTVVIPLGAQLQDEDGNELGRVTIESVNGGTEYVFDQAAVDKYGWREKEITFDDVTTPRRLLEKGLQELALSISPLDSIEISALDLRQVGVNVDSIRFLDYVKVSSPFHGIEATLLVTKLTIDLLDKSNNTFTVGSDHGSFTKEASTLTNRVSTIAENTVAEKMSSVNNVIKNLWTAITLSESNILQQVSAEYITQTQHGTAIESLSTALEQANNAFVFTFNSLTQNITEVNNELQTRFEEQNRYIRLEDGVVIIGEVGSPFELRISNSEVGIYQSGYQVAYFNDNRFYITNGEILTQLTLGDYAFIPRANGNLSFKWVG